MKAIIESSKQSAKQVFEVVKFYRSDAVKLDATTFCFTFDENNGGEYWQAVLDSIEDQFFDDVITYCK